MLEVDVLNCCLGTAKSLRLGSEEQHWKVVTLSIHVKRKQFQIVVALKISIQVDECIQFPQTL
ncbi:hypothetical protein M5K25_008684 [Dendrobium thyrsiflorum]|uniref:Uncharacterized protein n=1 Tax=Dendrobium thyrsiflorum TaxID=117978 RepID=A0ABD0V9D5_DENTH